MGDPEELRALARRVGLMADEVRGSGLRLAAADGVVWHSVAAERFRRSVAVQGRSVRGRAAALEALADALLAHAAAVQVRLEQIAAAERFVVSRVVELEREAREQASGLVGSVVGAAEDAGRWVSGAVSAGAGWVLSRARAGDLPRSGSLEWLELAERLR